MPTVNAAQEKNNARKLLGQLFQCKANVIPLLEQGILCIQLLGLANDAMGPCTAAADRGTQ